MVPSLEAAARALRNLRTRKSACFDRAEAPIVLLPKEVRRSTIVSPVAPGNPYLGVDAALHAAASFAVARAGISGRRDERKSERRANLHSTNMKRSSALRGIADLFLVHDRPIVRHMDDSIVRVMAGREMMLRRARGYAPLADSCVESRSFAESPSSSRARRASEKHGRAPRRRARFSSASTSAIWKPTEAHAAFRQTAADLPRLYDVRAAKSSPATCIRIISRRNTPRNCRGRRSRCNIIGRTSLACMAENEVDAPALGVAWDGTGYGTGRDDLGRRVFSRAEGWILRTRGAPADISVARRRPRRSRTASQRAWECFTKS